MVFGVSSGLRTLRVKSMRSAPPMRRNIGPRTLFFLTLLAFAACCAAAQALWPTISWSKADVVLVEMREYAFQPGRIMLRRGVPTRLHLVNSGTEIHDFTAPEFFKTVELRTPAVVGSSTIGVSVAPHEEKDVALIATLPGHFRLICSDHDWAGMTAEIVVE